MLSELPESPKLVGLDIFVRPVVSGIPVCPEVFDRVVRAVMSLDRGHGKTLFSS